MKVLFVCLGNICRSPSSEGVFRTLSACTADSAGTAGWHVGKPPYGPMQQAAKARGYDFSDLRARQLSATDFTDFELIIGMDDSNLANIEALRPSGNTTSVRLFTDYAPETGMNEVPDPYYTRDFDGALTLIETCARNLVKEIG